MSKSRSCREYLILTDNIIVLGHIFNLTKKPNLIGRLYYDLTQCFDNLGVAYLFGPPCIRASLRAAAAAAANSSSSYILNAMSTGPAHFVLSSWWNRIPCFPF